MFTFLKEQRARSLNEKAKLTRQMTLETAFSRATTRVAPKEISTTPSLTAGTSQTDNSSELNEDSIQPEESRRISGRSCRIAGSYNENALSAMALVPTKKARTSESRTASGSTTNVDKRRGPRDQGLKQHNQTSDDDEDSRSTPGYSLKLSPKSYSSAKKRVSARPSILNRASKAIAKTKSVLGKRTRENKDTEDHRPAALYGVTSSRLRTRDPKPQKRSTEEPPAKKTRFSETITSSVSPDQTSPRKVVKKPRKIWLSQGLYVGQERDFDARFTESENRMRQIKSTQSAPGRKPLMSLPMFAGQRLVEQGRNFRLPFDVFSPLPPGQPKPDEWKKIQKNVFIGDAANIWKKTKPLEESTCICTRKSGCDENCFNRFMLYECDDTNCNLGAEFCTNRSFAGLKLRHKSGGAYNIGVEVMKTAERGYGIRANRCFAPNQIIVEYTGEIITQEECESRMRGRYKDAECYYLMDFDQSMILDATRGSIARFVNHSCSPNCRMIKWTVQDKPRMALFSGDKGIMTGEELTYDYNFSPYSIKNVQKCLCGAENCRGVLGPKPKEIKDALNPIAGGGKRKLQQAVENAVEEVKRVAKKRKINVPIPTSVKNAVSKAKEQVVGSANNPKKPLSKKKPLPLGWVYVEELAEQPPPLVRTIFGTDPEALLRSSRHTIKSKTKKRVDLTKIKTKRGNGTLVGTRKRQPSEDTEVEILGYEEEEPGEEVEELDDEAISSELSNGRVKVHSVRKNVVRTSKRRNTSDWPILRGDSVRII